MRSLVVTAPVRTPSAFALSFLRTYFDERKNDAAAPYLGLRFPLGTAGAGLTIDKSVAVDVQYVKIPGDGHALAISWCTPENEAFPRFSGRFAATPTGEEACLLTLEGSYSAPGGIAGSIFDATVGSRIAQSTIEGLLQRLASAAEGDYQTRLSM